MIAPAPEHHDRAADPAAGPAYRSGAQGHTDAGERGTGERRGTVPGVDRGHRRVSRASARAGRPSADAAPFSVRHGPTPQTADAPARRLAAPPFVRPEPTPRSMRPVRACG